ncbi:phage tail tape measure protein [Cupriavidus gilardii]|uniref:phage tail tape measure protein n=1 Tax=Cupriavidus gilardii TaxID=82541 RepID=UPI0021B39BB1|nr:phage tail tape measure protein [Cupriavidus gilardii]UXC37355.1 phage tail tape measure protein [Cupriavidus gilardii]
MAIGSIVVDLLAKTGSFETDLNRAAKLSERRAKEIEKSFIGVGTAVSAGLVAAGAAAVAIGNQAVDQLAQLDDMTQKTGASVERLSQIQQTATAFGQDFNQVDDAISRLAKGMATVDSETNKTQKALAALGLSARDAGGALRDPADLLVDVARRLQDYEDGASKAALANDLFGKSGASLLPFLNDLSENVDNFKGVSAQAAAQAAEFQDRLNRMRSEFQTLAQAVTSDVLPVLNRFLETINTIRNTSFTGWLFTSGDDAANPGKKLAEIDARLASIAKAKAELASGGGLAERIFGNTNDYDRVEKNLRNQRSYLQSLQQMQALANKSQVPDQVERSLGGGARRALNYTTGNPPKEPKGPKSQYERDLEAAKKLIESLKTQAATFGQSEAEAVKYKLTLQGLPQAIISTATALQQQVSDMAAADKVTKAMEEEFERQQEIRAQEAQYIAQSLMTQEQIENDSYNRRIEALKAYGQQSAAAAAEANALIEAESDRHAVALVDIQNRQVQDLNAFMMAQQQVDAQQLAGAEQFASNLYSVLEQAGQQNSALGKALFAAMKGIQVAQIIVQTEVAAAMVQAGLTAAAAQTAALAGPAAPAVLAAGIAAATTHAMITRAIGYANAGLVAGMAIAGQRANGGPVEAGKQYIVGERGREAFVPTTTGMIIPNHVLESGGGKDNITIVNNTRVALTQ